MSGSPGKKNSDDPFLFFAKLDNLFFKHIHVVQSVEQPAVNRVVEGSSPSMGASKTFAKKQALFAESRDSMKDAASFMLSRQRMVS